MGFCDFKDVVAFGNNQLWRPRAAKVKGHHSVLPQKYGQLEFIRCILHQEIVVQEIEVSDQNVVSYDKFLTFIIFTEIIVQGIKGYD